MKIIVRNFIHVLKRFKTASTLNIVGLGIAFAAFMVITMQVKYEYDYDRFHSTADRIVRVDFPANTSGDFDVILPRPLIEAVINSSPHIEEGTLLLPENLQTYFSVIQNGEKKGFKDVFTTSLPGLTRIFDFTFLMGDPNALNDPEKIIIPQSIAKKIFGDENPIGKHVFIEDFIWTKDRKELVVGAVYKDFPGNSQLKNTIYTAIDPGFNIDNWQSSNFISFLLLDDMNSASLVEESFNSNFDFSKLGTDANTHLRLTPLKDVYFESEKRDQRIFRGGSREEALLLLGIGLLVIIIATINFTNFSTSLVPIRIKSINTQKVLGSSVKGLRTALVGEAVLISFLAWIFALVLLFVCQNIPSFHFTEAGINLTQNISIVIGMGIFSLLIGLAAGLYPAWYITSFPPALVLKGNFGLTPKGRAFRTGLIGFQFIVSVILIIASSFVQIQRWYMQDFNMGFDKDQIAVIELNYGMSENSRKTLENELMLYAGIEGVAFSMEKVGSQDTYSTTGFEYNDTHIQYYMITVSPNFLSVMGIPVIEGRNHSYADEKSGKVTMVFNEGVRDKYNLPLGNHDFTFFDGDVIGFSQNTTLTSLREQDPNVAFTVGISDLFPVGYIRLKAGTDYMAAVDHIQKSITRIDPALPSQVEFYDKIFEQLYYKEAMLNKLVSFFSLLAIILSIVGIFGLIMFETQYRRKEIGIRKVMGAEIEDILVMFNKTYLHIISVCFIIAAPIAYYGITRWLENFAYKTPIYWWVFVLAFIWVSIITMGTVTFQSWNAAIANPADSVKSE